MKTSDQSGFDLHMHPLSQHKDIDALSNLFFEPRDQIVNAFKGIFGLIEEQARNQETFRDKVLNEIEGLKERNEESFVLIDQLKKEMQVMIYNVQGFNECENVIHTYENACKCEDESMSLCYSQPSSTKNDGEGSQMSKYLKNEPFYSNFESSTAKLKVGVERTRSNDTSKSKVVEDLSSFNNWTGNKIQHTENNIRKSIVTDYGDNIENKNEYGVHKMESSSSKDKVTRITKCNMNSTKRNSVSEGGNIYADSIMSCKDSDAYIEASEVSSISGDINDDKTPCHSVESISEKESLDYSISSEKSRNKTRYVLNEYTPTQDCKTPERTSMLKKSFTSTHCAESENTEDHKRVASNIESDKSKRVLWKNISRGNVSTCLSESISIVDIRSSNIVPEIINVFLNSVFHVALSHVADKGEQMYNKNDGNNNSFIKTSITNNNLISANATFSGENLSQEEQNFLRSRSFSRGRCISKVKLDQKQTIVTRLNRLEETQCDIMKSIAEFKQNIWTSTSPQSSLDNFLNRLEVLEKYIGDLSSLDVQLNMNRDNAVLTSDKTGSMKHFGASYAKQYDIGENSTSTIKIGNFDDLRDKKEELNSNSLNIEQDTEKNSNSLNNKGEKNCNRLPLKRSCTISLIQRVHELESFINNFAIIEDYGETNSNINIRYPNQFIQINTHPGVVVNDLCSQVRKILGEIDRLSSCYDSMQKTSIGIITRDEFEERLTEANSKLSSPLPKILNEKYISQAINESFLDIKEKYRLLKDEVHCHSGKLSELAKTEGSTSQIREIDINPSFCDNLKHSILKIEKEKVDHSAFESFRQEIKETVRDICCRTDEKNKKSLELSFDALKLELNDLQEYNRVIEEKWIQNREITSAQLDPTLALTPGVLAEIDEATKSMKTELEVSFEAKYDAIVALSEETRRLESQLAEVPSQSQIDAMIKQMQEALTVRIEENQHGTGEMLQKLISNMKSELGKRLTKAEVIDNVRKLLDEAKIEVEEEIMNTSSSDSLMIGRYQPTRCIGCNQPYRRGVNPFLSRRQNHNALPSIGGLHSYQIRMDSSKPKVKQQRSSQSKSLNSLPASSLTYKSLRKGKALKYEDLKRMRLARPSMIYGGRHR